METYPGTRLWTRRPSSGRHSLVRSPRERSPPETYRRVAYCHEPPVNAFDQHRYRQRAVDYLDDASVSPLPFRRMAERDQFRASEVLGRVLCHKTFDWQRDGEKLMRQRKRSFFDRAPLPRCLTMSTRLATYVGPP
jgi:hypothetical protein